MDICVGFLLVPMNLSEANVLATDCNWCRRWGRDRQTRSRKGCPFANDYKTNSGDCTHTSTVVGVSMWGRKGKRSVCGFIKHHGQRGPAHLDKPPSVTTHQLPITNTNNQQPTTNSLILATRKLTEPQTLNPLIMVSAITISHTHIHYMHCNN